MDSCRIGTAWRFLISAMLKLVAIFEQSEWWDFIIIFLLLCLLFGIFPADDGRAVKLWSAGFDGWMDSAGICGSLNRSELLAIPDEYLTVISISILNMGGGRGSGKGRGEESISLAFVGHFIDWWRQLL